jgi:hypothetical protein
MGQCPRQQIVDHLFVKIHNNFRTLNMASGGAADLIPSRLLHVTSMYITLGGNINPVSHCIRQLAHTFFDGVNYTK